MPALDQYELLDFGAGRRLERFGPFRVDRPCPAAESLAQATPEAWAEAGARFERTAGEPGQWSLSAGLPDRWNIACDQLHFEIKPTEFGQVGLFPEQAGNWQWIAAQVKASPTPVRVLNLFAYTGGSTLAAAAAGAEVTHVDAAKNIVAWARRNSALSQLTAAPIHWIVEDAAKFVRRELRRGHRYEAVILDPPSYGHGAHGEVWRLSKDLGRLLALCGQLTEGRRRFMLLTCHTPGFDAQRLREMMAEALGDAQPGQIAAEELTLRTAAGRELPSGVRVVVSG